MSRLADNEKHLKRLTVFRKLGYLGLIFWPAFLIAGGMAFDAPSSGREVLLYIVLSICVGYGVLPFIAPRLAKKALAAGRIKFAYVLAAVPCSILPAIILANFVIDSIS